jgi:hypothetical protein
MDYNMYQGDTTSSTAGEGIIPWLIRKITMGDADFYKRSAAENDQIQRTAQTAKPALAPAAATATPAVAPVAAVERTPLAEATQTAGASYDDPDTAQALQQAGIDPRQIPAGNDPYSSQFSALAEATKGQPGILQRIINNPQAAALLGQMGAGMLRGKGFNEGLANAAEAASAFTQKSQAVKRTPIANGTAILEEYPDGTSKVVPVQGAAKPKAPTGYQWTADGQLEAIPGGPKDLEAVKLSQTLENNFTRLTTKNENVVGAIDKALGQVSAFSAGPIGQATSWIGGTPGADLEGTLDEIQANIGFAELEDMRKSSPTGGALGQVAVRELEFLQAVKGSLKQKQTPAQLRANLERIKQEFVASRQRLQEAYERDIAAGLIQRGSRPSLEGGGGASKAPSTQGGSTADRARSYLD